MVEEKRQVKIEYRKGPDYRIFAVAGAAGAVNAQQQVVLDFFIEKNETTGLTLEIEGDKVTREIPEGTKIIREFQAGFVIRPDIAFAIGNWLIQRAKEAGLQIVSERKNRNGD